MNNLFYPALVLAPVACIVSCSEPHEEVEGYLEELADVIKDHEDESFPELVEAIHDFTQDETSGLVDTLLDLSETEKKLVVERVIKSDALKLLTKRILQAAVAQAIDHPEIIRTAIAISKNHFNEKKLVEQSAPLFPYETQMQLIDIAGDFAKIAVAAGLDEQAIRIEAGLAIASVIAEYTPVSELLSPSEVENDEYRDYDTYRSMDDEYDYNTYGRNL